MIYDSIQEARENDADELREKIIANKSVLDERIIKEKQVEMTKSGHCYHLKKKCLIPSTFIFLFH